MFVSVQVLKRFLPEKKFHELNIQISNVFKGSTIAQKINENVLKHIIGKISI